MAQKKTSGRSSGSRKGIGGRKSKYDPATMPLIAKWMHRSGQTDAQIAKEFGVTEQTLNNWKKKYPELFEALKGSGNFVDYLATESLLKRALGYEYDSTEVKSKRFQAKIKGVPQYNADGSPLMINVPVEIKKKTVHVSPDTTACIFWLKNRQKELWRDKPQGGDGGKGEFEEFINALEASMRKHEV